MASSMDNSALVDAPADPGKLYSEAFKDQAKGRILLAFSALNLGSKIANRASEAYESTKKGLSRLSSGISSSYNWMRGRQPVAKQLGGGTEDKVRRGLAYRAAMEEILKDFSAEDLGDASVIQRAMARLGNKIGESLITKIPGDKNNTQGGRRRRRKNRKTRKSKR